MVDQTYEQELLDHVRKLSADKQRRVLEFVKELERPPGEPGESLIRHAHQINFPPEDLAEMEAALQDLEEIDPSDWDLPS